MDKHISIELNDKDQKALVIMAALAPCLVMGIYIFGVNMLLITVAAAASALIFQYVFDKAMKKDSLFPDYSALVTGMILAFTLPARVPLWIPVCGSLAAIVVKELLGGFGEKTATPAVTANVLLQLIFRVHMTTWPLNDFVKTSSDDPEAVTGSTPLGMLAEGKELPGLLRMLIGFVSGPCGAVSVAAVLIGGGYLLWKKVISPVVPLGMIATIFVFAMIYYAASGAGAFGDSAALMPQGGESAAEMAAFHVMAGSAVYFAFFGAALFGSAIKDSFADYAADSPEDTADKAAGSTEDTAGKASGGKGKSMYVDPVKLFTVIYAVGAGVLTMIMRLWGPLEDGSAFAVLIMDIVTYLMLRYMSSKQRKEER